MVVMRVPPNTVTINSYAMTYQMGEIDLVTCVLIGNCFFDAIPIIWPVMMAGHFC